MALENIFGSTVYFQRDFSAGHWRRLVKNIGGENQNFGRKNMVKTDKCTGISQLSVACDRAAPQNLRLWYW